jgi:hypothetical protein
LLSVWLVSDTTAVLGAVNTSDEKRGEGNCLAEKLFMRVDEIAEALDVSKPYAYKLIRQLNGELKEKGCIIIAGRIDRKYFHEKFYGSYNAN